MIQLYDTMARKKRDFVPGEPDRVTMYVCGPTVYGRAHIGNARPAVVFDTLSRLLRHTYGENSLSYARNITDVDDKIIDAASVEGVSIREITTRYEKYYLEDMGALGVIPPDFAPHATAFVPRMIDMIGRLIAAGFAYEAEGHVLFEVSKDPEYGVLSRHDRESLRAGARVEVAAYKRDDGDFVLWKPSADHVVGWESPWGRGRPGWHIECSAMIENWFGDVKNVETIDIHGGGIDLIFPHHENENAQSRCVHGGKKLAEFWVHNGFVDMGNEKMSKSLGNVVTTHELLMQGHRGSHLRHALLSAHYRQPLSWTDSLVGQSQRTVDRWRNKWERRHLGSEIVIPTKRAPPHPTVTEALNDDLNTPKALAALGKLFDGGEWASIEGSADLLGINFKERPADWAHDMRARIEAQVAERDEAKKNRDFSNADRIRDELAGEGVILEDGPSGTTWRRA